MEAAELSIVVNRPTDEVFTYLANLENDAQWRREWVDARQTSDSPPGLGATFLLVGELLGRRNEVVYETIEYEPHKRAAWKTESGPLPMTFRRTFERSTVAHASRSDTRLSYPASSSWSSRSLCAWASNSWQATSPS